MPGDVAQETFGRRVPPYPLEVGGPLRAVEMTKDAGSRWTDDPLRRPTVEDVG
ncbi:MAG: hypothetical protein O2930_10855 [Acidobacteria bacterium]|nr:hypothetical protein [Acidobacteriota bacterium]